MAHERYKSLLPRDQWDYYHGLLNYTQTRGGVDGTYHSQYTSGNPSVTPVTAPYDVTFTPSPMGEIGMGDVTQTSPTSPDVTGMELLGMMNLSHMYPEYGEKAWEIISGDLKFSKRAQHKAAYHDAWRKRNNPLSTESHASTYGPASGRWFRTDPRINTDQLMDEINAILASRGFAEDYPREGYPFSHIDLAEHASLGAQPGEELGEEEGGAMPYPALELHEYGHEAYHFFENNPDALVDEKGEDLKYYNPVTGSFESVRNAIMDRPSVDNNWKWQLKRGQDQESMAHLVMYSSDWREGRRTRGAEAPVPLPKPGTNEFNKLRSISMALNKAAYRVIENVLEKNRMRGRTASGM